MVKPGKAVAWRRGGKSARHGNSHGKDGVRRFIEGLPCMLDASTIDQLGYVRYQTDRRLVLRAAMIFRFWRIGEAIFYGRFQPLLLGNARQSACLSCGVSTCPTLSGV